ncbi:tigger transposable element-derived protein 1-like [Stegodyphus dumicola]|uniref:tigger transposable element-derived protein 1-like n=1 Tax=Stegodyphus dumicola TaxID=202533 RepID=UPI0015A9F2D6|nr:tigger transposable element-derived protein 1-like [Stegodyphus dumicola]
MKATSLNKSSTVMKRGFSGRKMPRRTYITEEEKKLPGHKPMKDRLTLALCANASGDLKIKPLLVYHSENPRAFKAHNVSKDKLAVFWRSNAKVWVTRLLFVEWVNCCFGPAVKKYLEENDLSLKCLLVLDNAPAHPPGLEEQIHPDFDFIKVLYLPPNTTSILQPMDQQVIANFKKLYTKHLFKRCFEVTESTQLTLRLRAHLELSVEELWAAVVAERDFEGFEIPTEEEAVDDPAPLEESKSLGLVVDEADIDNLLDEHKEELNTDDLKTLEAMQISDLQEEHRSSVEEEVEVALTSTEIREAIAWFENLNSFIETKHPEKMRTARAMDNVNDICMSHFRNILRSRQKQASLDRYFSKRNAPESEEASVSSKKTRKESEDDDVSPQI